MDILSIIKNRSKSKRNGIFIKIFNEKSLFNNKIKNLIVTVV